MQCYTFCGSQKRPFFRFGRVQLKCDGTHWRTGGELKGKLANAVGSRTLHTTSEHGVSSITTADALTSAVSSQLNWRPPADLNGLVTFAERQNLVPAGVPSHFKRSLLLHRLLYLFTGWSPGYCLFTVCFFLVTAWSLPGYFLFISQLLPGSYRVNAWLLPGYYTVTCWLLPGYFLVTVLLLPD